MLLTQSRTSWEELQTGMTLILETTVDLPNRVPISRLLLVQLGPVRGLLAIELGTHRKRLVQGLATPSRTFMLTTKLHSLLLTTKLEGLGEVVSQDSLVDEAQAAAAYQLPLEEAAVADCALPKGLETSLACAVREGDGKTGKRHVVVSTFSDTILIHPSLRVLVNHPFRYLQTGKCSKRLSSLVSQNYASM